MMERLRGKRQDLVSKATQGNRKVSYGYDEMERPKRVSALRTDYGAMSGDYVENSYSYANDRLTGIESYGKRYCIWLCSRLGDGFRYGSKKLFK